MPQTGFDENPSIEFLLNNNTLATESTRGCRLRLPTVHCNYSSFKEYMLMSIKGNDGFGCT